MKTPLIRQAKHSDTPAIKDLCRAIDPDDYAAEAWPAWLSQSNAVNLVAEVENRIIGCARGEVMVFPDAWSQAVRVHPEMQRSGVGLRLMAFLEKELMRRGITAVLGNIGTFNGPSLAFFTRQNWRTVCTIKRRAATQRIAIDRKHMPATREKIIGLIKRFPVLASIEKVAYFRRVYISMNDDFLDKAMTSQSARIAPDGNAFALLDPGKGNLKRIWVTALAGSVGGMKQLIEGYMAEASAPGMELIIDSPDDPEIQAFMDDYQFEPPQKNGAYYVVKKELRD